MGICVSARDKPAAIADAADNEIGQLPDQSLFALDALCLGRDKPAIDAAGKEVEQPDPSLFPSRPRALRSRGRDKSAPDAAGKRVERPDLTGTWSARGPPDGMDAFLADLKLMGCMERKWLLLVMRTFTAKLVIAAEGDELIFDSHGRKGVTSLRFRLEELFESRFGHDDEPGAGSAFWEGDALVVRAQLPSMSMEVRRRVVGGRLEEETTGKRGVKEATIKRTWTRS